MPLLRRRGANSGSNVRPATGVPDHRAANSEKETTLTKQANDFRGRIFSREDLFARGYFREKIFSREDIFAGRYFRVNSKFAKISSRENISNSLFAKCSSRENKVLYSRPSSIGNGVDRRRILSWSAPAYYPALTDNCQCKMKHDTRNKVHIVWMHFLVGPYVSYVVVMQYNLLQKNISITRTQLMQNVH